MLFNNGTLLLISGISFTEGARKRFQPRYAIRQLGKALRKEKAGLTKDQSSTRLCLSEENESQVSK